MNSSRRATTALLLLSVALISASLVGPLRDAAVMLWSAGLAAQLAALVVALRAPRSRAGTASARGDGPAEER